MMIFRIGSDRVTFRFLETAHYGWVSYLELVAAPGLLS